MNAPRPRAFVLAAATASAATVAALVFLPGAPEPDELAAVEPVHGLAAREARAAYGTLFADCHGERAEGRGCGPPLVHRVYEPAHHADAAFRLSILRGAPRHQGPFGPMPPQPTVGPAQTEPIIRYVRELQRAGGTVCRRGGPVHGEANALAAGRPPG